MSARLAVLTAVVATLGTTADSRADKLFVTDYSNSLTSPAFRMNLDGSKQEELFPTLSTNSYAEGIAVDSHHAKLYVVITLASVRGVSGIYRSNLDGSDLELLLAETLGSGIQISLDVDARHEKLYWSDRFGSIHCVNVSGGAPKVINLGGDALDVAVDPSREQIYWLDPSSHEILRAHVSGGAAEIIADTSNDPSRHSVGALALDLVHRNVYWVSEDRRIGMASMDGGEVQIIREEDGLAIDVAIDAPRGHLYWTRLSGQIVRANLDGTEVTIVAPDLTSGTWGIALQLDCGNGRVDPGEICDVAIEPGWTGECVTDCFDNDPCTSDDVTGFGTCTAQCEFETITEPIDNDGCCPNDSLTLVDDSDCALSPWPDVPAVSTWGAVLLSLLLAVGITLKWRGHQAAA